MPLVKVLFVCVFILFFVRIVLVVYERFSKKDLTSDIELINAMNSYFVAFAVFCWFMYMIVSYFK